MLVGKRIFLRRFQVEDAPVLLKWGQDERYHRLAGFERLSNLTEAEKSAREYVKRQNSYALCLKETQQVIGLVELYERGMDEQSGLLKTKELGFLLSKAYEGKGYMTEALQLIFNQAFEKEDQVEIWAGTFVDNLHSQHLLENLGFKYVYTADYSQLTQIFSYREKYYLLKRAEWLKMEPNTKS
ncbi:MULTISPECIES: GNAT family N-acetyltransferase [Lactobacillus]|uniref:N-acetyltransferase n=1 Tax=Lactobacillus xujianguonis TaxID=2495899 RepID=A0A437ST95_9LACO|nr:MULTISPECIES: GNAT family N-acetyltransferase [Lactobacillus]RVU70128.1 N-acetyltransferase [Lactobacillus xujianguonis]RVU73346.1 N-acetyltransferase [Lactobacillus xujianguonis]